MTARERQVADLMRTRERQVADLLGGVFQVGERVQSKDDYGPLICDESLRAREEPRAEYVVVATTRGWVQLRDDDGKLYTPSIGSSYFRIVGPCGLHRVGGWKHVEGDALWAACARCDAPMPEHVSRYWMEKAGAVLPSLRDLAWVATLP